jgi:integrase
MQVSQMRYVKKPPLTVKDIREFPKGRHYRGHGLVLIVTPQGRRFWRFRHTSPRTHRVTETAIGEWPYDSYTFARQEAYRMMAMVAKGEDPVLVKRQQRGTGTTFAEACEGWINKHKSKWRSTRHLKYLIGKHGKSLAETPVRMITSSMIEKTLSGLWERHPEQARRALRMWARVFDYARVMGYRAKDQDNPATWRGNMEHIFPDRPKNHNNHHSSLPFKELPELITRLRRRQARGQSAGALEFLILTAARTGEIRNMKWLDIDLINRVWKEAPEQTEQKRRYRTPLSERCMEILAVQQEYRTSDFVFTGYNRRALDEKALRELLQRRMKIRVSVHGFRSSFRNWGAHNRPPQERDLLELCLGHKVKGKVEGAYWTDDMLEERREIMKAWAAYLG